LKKIVIFQDFSGLFRTYEMKLKHSKMDIFHKKLYYLVGNYYISN
jgi:hypothetical protein